MKYTFLVLGLLGCNSGPEKNQIESASVPILSNVDADADGYAADEDCDDNDPTVNPGAQEVCDEVDNDCNGQIDEGFGLTFYADSDDDGYGNPDDSIEACVAPQGYTDNALDCDDQEPLAWTDAEEVCDGIDNNCDGVIDEDAIDLLRLFLDNDGDGFGQDDNSIESCEWLSGYVEQGGDCDDTDALSYPEAPELCDGIDNDCNGQIDDDVSYLDYFIDFDGDGFGDSSSTPINSCLFIEGSVTNNLDCNDIDPSINPDAPEVCNGFDDNCNAVEDDGLSFSEYFADNDGDGYGDSLSGQSACEQPSGTVTDNTDCDDTNDNIYPTAPELCDGFDNNCNNQIDENLSYLDYYTDSDGDGFGDSSSTPTNSCLTIDGAVTNNADCDDTDPNINPSASEVCDGIDNDCSNGADDGLTFTDYYSDEDSDGFGNPLTGQNLCEQPSGTVTDNTDCDDTNDNIYPTAPELCDGVDNNCNNQIDENLSYLDYYTDSDGDGFGDSSSTPTNSCLTIDGAVTNNADCDDTDPNINPSASEVCDGIDNDCSNGADDGLSFADYYTDSDGDGYGDSQTGQSACDQPSGTVTDATDCDDNNQNIYPTAPELCDGLDNDCNNSVDDNLTFEDYFTDNDGDGFGDSGSTPANSCAPVDGAVTNNTDCNDNESSINPSANEQCNGIDDDCNGSVDDSLSFVDYYTDADNDGYGDPSTGQSLCAQPSGTVTDNSDCDDNNSASYPGNTEVCDGIDNDCDGNIDGPNSTDAQTYYFDTDSDGYGDSSNSVIECSPPSGYVDLSGDCNDSDFAINPGSNEVCDGLDNDCNGQIDDGLLYSNIYQDSDGDGFGDASNSLNTCSQLSGYVSNSTDCDDGNPNINPNANEVCDNIDNDCDGTTDGPNSTDAQTYYFDEDGDGYGDTQDSLTSCTQPTGYVLQDNDCVVDDPDVNPGAQEVCNGEDDDCNNQIDDGLSFSTVYEDFDGDGFGDPTSAISTCEQLSGYVQDNTDCDDLEFDINPDAEEFCDGVDNNCDGSTDGPDSIDADIGFLDLDGDGFGSGPEVSSCDPLVGSDEDCDDTDPDINPDAAEALDAIDNNCDGDIDEGQVLNNLCYQENYDGASYQFCEYFLGYEDFLLILGARNRCAQDGYSLVIIDDIDENNFLENNASNGDWWIGLEETNSGWQWIDGSPVGYSNYAGSFGNSGDRSYFRQSNGLWYSGDYYVPRYFICEANF